MAISQGAACVTRAPPPITADHVQVIFCLSGARRTVSLPNSITRHLLVEGICQSSRVTCEHNRSRHSR
jgi:hypothetical protein